MFMLNPMEVCKVRLESPLTLIYFDNSKLTILKYRVPKVMGWIYIYIYIWGQNLIVNVLKALNNQRLC